MRFFISKLRNGPVMNRKVVITLALVTVLTGSILSFIPAYDGASNKGLEVGPEILMREFERGPRLHVIIDCETIDYAGGVLTYRGLPFVAYVQYEDTFGCVYPVNKHVIMPIGYLFNLLTAGLFTIGTYKIYKLINKRRR